MVTAYQELFEVEGLRIGDKVNVISGSFDPSVQGQVAPMGSMFLRTNGQTWKKIGLGDQEWEINAGDIDDDSAYVLKTRSIIVTDTYEVEFDVGVVSFNHYYEDGVECKLMAPNYYDHPVTIKNLSGNKLTILPDIGRVEGKRKLKLHNKMSSVTLSPLQNDWVMVSHVDGYRMLKQGCDHNGLS